MLQRKHRRGVTVVELLIITVLAVIGLTFCLAAARVADEADNRRRCASHLRQIGQAILLYSNDNKGAYPRTLYAADEENPVPVAGTPYWDNPNLGSFEKSDPFADEKNADAAKYRPKANDVTAAFFLLMRTQDITSEVFVCPSSKQTRWDFGGGENTALSWTNWAGRDVLRNHLSYSYVNPYPSKGAVAAGYRVNNALGKDFAVASDMNSGSPELLKLTVKSTREQFRRANSPNHARAGQNVLFADGHVKMCLTPFVGVRQDNIFTGGESGDAKPESGGETIVGSPKHAGDSVLLPTEASLATLK